jgi:hypothetical protein
MPGASLDERLRNMSLIGLAMRESNAERKKYISSIKVLVEMQQTVQERKFREQLLRADKNTQVFFNELMKSLRRDTAEAKKESIKGLSQLDLITRSKLNLHDLLDDTIEWRKRSEVADSE